MAGKKAPRKTRPKTPSRVKRTKKARRPRGMAHPELVGLGLVAVGLFLTAVSVFGWDGGAVGDRLDRGLDDAIGAARLVLPLVLMAVGALMVFRSKLVDVRPFRTGMILVVVGLVTALGNSHGGALGSLFEDVFGRLIGSTGTAILGGFALAAGLILVTGASVGALLRRSAEAARAAHARAAEARRARAAALPPPEPLTEEIVARPSVHPVDGERA